MTRLRSVLIMAAAIVLGAALVQGPSPACATERERLYGRLATIGRSVEGRPIRVVRLGNARAARKVLVVGAIHGDEPAGKAVVRALRRRAAPTGVELWLLPDLNPDGAAAGTRQNANGVDLNRNFPHRWRAQGVPGSTFYSGARPLSEPESRLAARLIARLRPETSIWYHQALALVDLGSGADPALVRRYARLSGLPARHIGFLPGVATRWQNARYPTSSAFVVELAAGPLSVGDVRRHVRATLSVALASRPMPVATREKVVALAEDLGSRRRLAAALGVSPAQVTRWARGGGIDPENAERLDLLELAFSGLSRLYEPAVIEDWLFGLNPQLGDRRPIDLIRARALDPVLAALRAEWGESYA